MLHIAKSDDVIHNLSKEFSGSYIYASQINGPLRGNMKECDHFSINIGGADIFAVEYKCHHIRTYRYSVIYW